MHLSFPIKKNLLVTSTTFSLPSFTFHISEGEFVEVGQPVVLPPLSEGYLNTAHTHIQHVQLPSQLPFRSVPVIWPKLSLCEQVNLSSCHFCRKVIWTLLTHTVKTFSYVFFLDSIQNLTRYQERKHQKLQRVLASKDFLVSPLKKY